MNERTIDAKAEKTHVKRHYHWGFGSVIEKDLLGIIPGSVVVLKPVTILEALQHLTYQNE